MSKNKIIEETVETIIDNIEEKLVDYMFDLGDYSETNNKFYEDKEELFNEVVKELNNRIIKYKSYTNSNCIPSFCRDLTINSHHSKSVHSE